MRALHQTATIAATIALTVSVWLLVMSETRTVRPQSEILKPTPTPQGSKRYVLWNKKQFERKPGQVSAMSVGLLNKIGAENVKQLEQINGFTFENQNAAQALMQNVGEEWVLQEEQEHHILGFTCSRCEVIPCPTDPTPIPQCPSPPGRGPCGPVDPGPTPTCTAKSWGITRVKACEAQALVDTSGVKIAIIDTGLDANHPGNGSIASAVSFTGEPVSPDPAGHGTHVNGTVGGSGGVGVAPASKKYICKGLNNRGSGTSSGLAQCLMWAGQQGVHIVSNSWGSAQPDNLINQAIGQLTAKGVWVIVAAGNDSGPVNWPAKLSGTNPRVIAVASSNQSDQISSFSSRGPEIKFIAPGENITSNWPGGGTRPLSGTSMATPHVAGICAYGVAAGKSPCVKSSGTVGGYPFASALESAQ